MANFRKKLSMWRALDRATITARSTQVPNFQNSSNADGLCDEFGMLYTVSGEGPLPPQKNVGVWAWNSYRNIASAAVAGNLVLLALSAWSADQGYLWVIPNSTTLPVGGELAATLSATVFPVPTEPNILSYSPRPHYRPNTTGVVWAFSTSPTVYTLGQTGWVEICTAPYT